jgi:hypothetical protein
MHSISEHSLRPTMHLALACAIRSRRLFHYRRQIFRLGPNPNYIYDDFV